MDITLKDFLSELNRIFDINGLGKLLNKEKGETFYRLTEFLIEENEKYNLTAIKEPKKIILNHYADCAPLVKYLPKGASIIDVGCGAGFPTLPLAILRDDINITALDSTQKRVNFVNMASELLGLENVKAICKRAEEGGQEPDMRESFDFATARAVAELRILCELCVPYVKVGGELLALKGRNVQFELNDAKRAIATLGARHKETVAYTLTNGNRDEDMVHPMVIISKINKTPKDYPRVYAKISKKPL